MGSPSPEVIEAATAYEELHVPAFLRPRPGRGAGSGGWTRAGCRLQDRCARVRGRRAAATRRSNSAAASCPRACCRAATARPGASRSGSAVGLLATGLLAGKGWPPGASVSTSSTRSRCSMRKSRRSKTFGSRSTRRPSRCKPAPGCPAHSSRRRAPFQPSSRSNLKRRPEMVSPKARQSQVMFTSQSGLAIGRVRNAPAAGRERPSRAAHRPRALDQG